MAYVAVVVAVFCLVLLVAMAVYVRKLSAAVTAGKQEGKAATLDLQWD
jgi:hypothetical protein